ncbi:MAG TPA: hypothetical protein VHU15_09165 [Stellaceae bacterium]|jgi:hypothetical protein|nr:hypothetical protein [Stellaceae bacterium]
MKAILALLLLFALSGCAGGGDRSSDSDRQPVVYGGVSGGLSHAER